MNARLLSPLRVASLAALSVVAMSAATPAYAADGDVRIVEHRDRAGLHLLDRRGGDAPRLRAAVVVRQRDGRRQEPHLHQPPAEPRRVRRLRRQERRAGHPHHGGGREEAALGQRLRRAAAADVAVQYKLDGKTVEPGDIVGKSGKLDVEYTVENVTGKSQEVTFDDGKGGTVTKTVDVPIPMVGSLSLVAPSSFTNVSSQQANIAGDGKGGTKLSFTMTLFPPIGSTTADFGYTADIKDGVVPRSEISALPVNPLDSPTFKTAARQLQGRRRHRCRAHRRREPDRLEPPQAARRRGRPPRRADQAARRRGPAERRARRRGSTRCRQAGRRCVPAGRRARSAELRGEAPGRRHR